MTYSYIFCELCGKVCDIEEKDGYKIYICEDCGEVKGIPSETWLCLGCENFDVLAPVFRNTKIKGYCDAYPRMPFKMFKRKSKCKCFSQEY